MPQKLKSFKIFRFAEGHVTRCNYTCNAILLLRDENLANTRLHYILLMHSSHIKQPSQSMLCPCIYIHKSTTIAPQSVTRFCPSLSVVLQLIGFGAPTLHSSALDHIQYGEFKIFLLKYDIIASIKMDIKFNYIF